MVSRVHLHSNNLYLMSDYPSPDNSPELNKRKSRETASGNHHLFILSNHDFYVNKSEKTPTSNQLEEEQVEEYGKCSTQNVFQMSDFKSV